MPRRALLQHRMTQCDIQQRQPAMPKQDRLILAFPAGAQTGDDLPKLGIQRFLGQPAASTWARRLPNFPPLHWPQSSTTSFDMMSVSDNSTALIVP